jgi:hypothetical protein
MQRAHIKQSLFIIISSAHNFTEPETHQLLITFLCCTYSNIIYQYTVKDIGFIPADAKKWGNKNTVAYASLSGNDAT